MGLVVPFLRIRLVVVLHQRAKEDDEDDLQDEADDRQLQTHVGGRVGHFVLPVVRRAAEVGDGCSGEAVAHLGETEGGCRT